MRSIRTMPTPQSRLADTTEWNWTFFVKKISKDNSVIENSSISLRKKQLRRKN